MRLFLFLLLVIGTVSFSAYADMDEGLYDPKAPEGSSFVRFLNVSGEDLVPGVSKKKYELLSDSALSPYFVVPEGTVTIKAGELSRDQSVQAGKFYTVVATDELSVFDDPLIETRRKAVIGFYNLNKGANVNLTAGDQHITVFENVVPQDIVSREINAVKIVFHIGSDEQESYSIEENILERGEYYSIFAYKGQGLFFRAETDTTQ